MNLSWFLQEVDTALVKLHIEMNSSSLQDLVSSENSCSVQDTVTWLQKYEVRQQHKDVKLIAARREVTVPQKLSVPQHFNVALTPFSSDKS